MPLPSSVSIIGASGALGQGLALRWAQAGVPLVLGSREADRGSEAAAAVVAAVPGAAVEGVDNVAAAAASPVVVLSVPFSAQAKTVKQIGESLQPGQLVIDASVPLAAQVGGKPTQMLGVWQGSAAQQAASLLPEGVGIVSALHTVSAAMLADPGHKFDEDVLVCGDDKEQKAVASALIEAIAGLRAVDAGRLENSRITESLTALMIGINIRNKAHAGIRITGL
ncbi:MAG: NADPH-dependent F420 reductase [Solirubrobacteraceae bacterium]|jgi:8-hydroxy-5-deazaflavin:NADPH oxidoreductase|nr:NADPH-dependent F420 reductase [Solirubrobacteraceae bacterium]MDP4672705.1 NADPH-dependent F420 reductase [Solirubrobacteraceae bacterium]MDP4921226.1 NADPH-dependent F420 reductase [Solirubrobacteraceae bacterium]